jgi:hypothetical protein
MTEHERPAAEENFGQASLGEAQSDDPPLDPDMLEHDHEGDDENVGDADEQLGIDPDADEDEDSG